MIKLVFVNMIPNLMYNILHMLVVQQLQLDHDIRPDGSKPLPSI